MFSSVAVESTAANLVKSAWTNPDTPSKRFNSVAVEVTATSSFILGEVKVLFVKVCVPVSVTSPAPNAKVSISGLVPSFAVANKIAVPLSVVAKVNVSPEPEVYLNWTVWAPDVEFLKK